MRFVPSGQNYSCHQFLSWWLKQSTGLFRFDLSSLYPFSANKKDHFVSEVVFFIGAGDEARTRYLHLGKVALYRMSYTRSELLYNNRLF